MRAWLAYIADTVARIARAAHRRVAGIVLAPHYSALSVGAYEARLREAARDRLDPIVVPRWAEEPHFLDAVAGRVTRALERFPAAPAVRVIFTAHSLPERIRALGDPYPTQLAASAAAVAARAGLRDC